MASFDRLKAARLPVCCHSWLLASLSRPGVPQRTAGELVRCEAPIERFRRAELRALKSVAGIPPFHAARELIRRVQADCAVEIDGNAYSVPWRLIGETVRATISDGIVRIYHASEEEPIALQSAWGLRHNDGTCPARWRRDAAPSRWGMAGSASDPILHLRKLSPRPPGATEMPEERVERRLAAILAADIADYSVLYGRRRGAHGARP